MAHGLTVCVIADYIRPVDIAGNSRIASGLIELWSISDLIPLAQGEMSKDSKLCLGGEVDFRTDMCHERPTFRQ